MHSVQRIVLVFLTLLRDHEGVMHLDVSHGGDFSLATTQTTDQEAQPADLVFALETLIESFSLFLDIKRCFRPGQF